MLSRCNVMSFVVQSDAFCRFISLLLREKLLFLTESSLVCCLFAYWFFPDWNFCRAFLRALFAQNIQQITSFVSRASLAQRQIYWGGKVRTFWQIKPHIELIHSPKRLFSFILWPMYYVLFVKYVVYMFTHYFQLHFCLIV